MSIVAVHGPNTFGSRGVQETGPVMGQVGSTGLKWDFALDQATTRSDQDFVWTFPPDGTPTPQNVANPTEVTYAAAGAVFGDPTRPTQPTKTAQCVVTNTAKATVNNRVLTNNVATLAFSAAHGFIPGQVVVVSGAVGAPFTGTFTLLTASGTSLTYAVTNADITTGATTGTVTSASTQYPAAGTYSVTVPVEAGAAPSLRMAAPESGDEEPTDVDVGFDPAAHTVDEVEAFVTEHPDQAQAVYDLEIEGKARVTLITWLEELEA